MSNSTIAFVENVFLSKYLEMVVRAEERRKEIEAMTVSRDSTKERTTGGEAHPEQERYIAKLEDDEEYKFCEAWIRKVDEYLDNLGAFESEMLKALYIQGIPEQTLMRQYGGPSRFRTNKRKALVKIGTMILKDAFSV
jgi:hypothetical protein